MKIHSLPSSVDLSRCILWQYNNAKRLQAIVGMMQDATEMASVDLWKKAFYIFDLDRPISETDDDYQYRLYGLSELSFMFGLERPKWTNGASEEYVSVDAWRRYLKGMIWLIDSDGSCSDTNKWLSIIFPDRKTYVIDNRDMTITYKFFPIPESTEEDWQLMNIDNFMPHPAGVTAIVSKTNTDSVLGLGSQVGTDYDENVKFNNPDLARIVNRT